MKEVKLAVVGYGHRAQMFCEVLKNPNYKARVVAIVDPDPLRQKLAKETWDLSDENIFNDVKEFCAQPKMADAVINATQDRLHLETTIPVMEKGYHVFLEKPMATSYEDCMKVAEIQKKTGVMVAVCHSLRYHLVYANIKKLIDEGKIGEVVSFDQLEDVGFLHYSHSYVRGNWGNQDKSSFMLLAKSCHDIDIFNYLIGKKCKKVSSFGKLTYFTEKNKPQGAPKYCLDGCPAEKQCPYHCGKIYIERGRFPFVFPTNDKEEIRKCLVSGPYGRCVFQADNNVVDHQVVNFEYEGGITGTFTMIPFSKGGRVIRIHGTKGFIKGSYEERKIELFDFETENTITIDIPKPIYYAHGGGDALILESFIEAMLQNKPELIRTSMEETLESHKVTFAAEKSRLEGITIDLE